MNQASRIGVHPFPARMAPEIALRAMTDLREGGVVLDPMCGSGTVVRKASELGLSAHGFDVDPLSVLMAKVWTTHVDVAQLLAVGDKVVSTAEGIQGAIWLPWIDEDIATKEFVEYWFAAKQRAQLRALVATARSVAGSVGDAIRLAISRIIVTKSGGASLAADTSHSRPHRVSITNEFDVFAGFSRSVRWLAHAMRTDPPKGGAHLRLGDARILKGVKSESVDAVVTSPPYVNAIDYLRGHRLALVWLGYRVRQLRAVRSDSIGSERAPLTTTWSDRVSEIAEQAGELTRFPPHLGRMVRRFTHDMRLVLRQTVRVLRPGGYAVFVVSNSVIRGVPINTAQIVRMWAQDLGLDIGPTYSREIPMDRRYLPPPQRSDDPRLGRRMRVESVLRFDKPKM